MGLTDRSRLHPHPTTSLIGEGRCHINHPTRPLMECALPFGHGAFHLCDPAEGEAHVWMGRRRTFLGIVEEVVVGAHSGTGRPIDPSSRTRRPPEVSSERSKTRTVAV